MEKKNRKLDMSKFFDISFSNCETLINYYNCVGKKMSNQKSCKSTNLSSKKIIKKKLYSRTALSCWTYLPKKFAIPANII